MAKKRGRRPAKATTIKTQEMIKEGYRPDVAAAAAHNMKRRGKLGPHGEYRRVHKKKRGPHGAQRAGAVRRARSA